MADRSPRIIAGAYRSRRLLGPRDDEATRPYLDRVKEAVFNMLRERCEDAVVLDLFAGVGTIGLEALSRGARHVVMVESDRRVFQTLRCNVESLECGDRVTPVLGDALGSSCLLRVPRPVDLVFVDPPYESMRRSQTRCRVLQQIAACGPIMEPRGLVILRSPLGPDEADLAVDGFQGPEPHQYRRDMWVHFYQPDRPPSPDDDLPTPGRPSTTADRPA
jgi:16S rRNA (guanine(966)-N(2))-methyltransferase RsmD